MLTCCSRFLGMLPECPAHHAQAMFQQLRADNAYEAISWRCLFSVVRQYCARYTPDADQQVGAARGC